MRRNTLVLFAVLFLLSIFGWAGWANWEYRRQAAEMRANAAAAHMEMVPAAAGDLEQNLSSLLDKPAPDFTLQNLSGKEVSLSSYKGKALLINFWATWCGPCKIETPWIVDLRNKYASQGFEVLGVSTEGDDVGPSDKANFTRDKDAVEKFATQMKVPYPVLMDGDSVSKPYGGLDELPTSFFVDRNGTVVATQLGLTSKADIEANIRKALASNQ